MYALVGPAAVQAGNAMPLAFAEVGTQAAVPARASAAVVGATALFVLLGDLAGVAAMTDAAVLVSFVLVNLALAWLSARRAIERRVADVLLPGAAVLLCLWLLSHVGWRGLATAAGLTGLALLLARRAR